MPMKDLRLVATITAVGILVCFSTPEQTSAAPGKPMASAEKPIVLAKFSKRRAHTAKKSRSARYAKKSSSTSSAKKSDDSKANDNKAVAKTAAMAKPELPAAIANAHAEAPKKPRTLAEDEAQNLAALDSTDVISTVDGVQIAASDQLNDVDRALTAESAPALVSTAAAPVAAEPVPTNKIVKAVPSGETPTVKKASDNDPWSQSSLIGKFFIALGGLLTLASAARIFIA